MALLKRIGYYLVGLSIGIVFLTFFLKKKTEETGTEFCYFPNCRTLKNIRSKPMSYSGDINKMLAEKEVDSMDIAIFLRKGDVDFGRSDTESEPCKTYYIDGTVDDNTAVLRVKNCRDEVILQSIELE